MNQIKQWERYKKYLLANPDIGLMIDISRMNFQDDFFKAMEPLIQRAFQEMEGLESGVLANPDEKRMVGHYWLRAPDLAPTPEIRQEIEETTQSIKDFARKVHSGEIRSPKGIPFSRLLLIGIGGSALGPQFVSHALKTPKDPMRPFFFDNTDPDGMDLVLGEIGEHLPGTLVLVISKSGKTTETRNGMLEARAVYEAKGLSFGKHAVAVTEAGSDLDHIARSENWLARFPMWDWVGGRTSETSAVGLLPAALQGIDIDSFLEGARLCDQATRRQETRANPAALLSLMWYHTTGGRGKKDMIILPYKDRLHLFPKYLQQLVMESLGKEWDLDGRRVHQGISVFGNKGSTDQHAYIQQLRDGVDNFFVTFIEVLHDREGPSLQVDPDVTSGDYLNGFLQGTQKALSEKGRESATITLERVNARSLGVLIALYERAVGLYASLIRVNAYHQPGVEAGKKAAGVLMELQARVLSHLHMEKGNGLTAEEIASAIGAPNDVEAIFKLLEHAAANEDHRLQRTPAPFPYETRYRYVHG